MQPLRLAIKLFTMRPIPREELHPFIGVFHRFIQDQVVPGLLIDVADYAHVPDGPGVMLIGHEVDYGIDLARGRTGLLTVRKRAGETDLAALFKDALAKTFATAQAIEAGPTVDVRFVVDALELCFPDRRFAPNTAAAFDMVSKELAPVARAVFGASAAFENASAGDPRRMLTLDLTGDGADLATKLARLESR